MFLLDDFLQLEKKKKRVRSFKKGFFGKKLGPIHHIMRGKYLKSPNLEK
jgi:hypothetical protein